jgi:hypothetical protein
MVFAHIAVGQHIVTQMLGVAQAGAVAQHDPGMRAQHRDVVGDGLGVGRAHANVDHGDATAVGAHQVVGGHLRQARGHGAQYSSPASAIQAQAACHHIARLDERDVFTSRVLPWRHGPGATNSSM